MKLLLTPLFVFSLVAVPAFGGDTWTSFQNGGAISVEEGSGQNVRLSDKIQWSVELPGYGQSSPVVWDGYVYVTTVEGDNKDQCHVTAYQLSNGEKRWQHTVLNASPVESSNYVSRAAPTPVVDRDGVICFFEGGNVVALNHDGTLRWERNLVEDYGELKARHGLSASVEQNDELAFVWIERSEDPYVLSLNKKTGKTAWKIKGVGATSWASPRLVPVDGGHHLVLSAVGSIIGVDPDSGGQLWLLDGISGNSTPTPMPLGEGRFLIGATVGRGESGGGRAAESNGVVTINKQADGTWSADYVWRAKRATSSFGSPMAHNGLAYFVNREGVLYGLNLNDGTEVFAKRLKGSMWATPFGVGDHVFFFGRDGKVNMLSDADSDQTLTTWDELPEPPKPETRAKEGGPPGMSSGPVLYAASWCGDHVLFRRGDRLFAVRTETSSTKSTTEGR